VNSLASVNLNETKRNETKLTCEMLLCVAASCCVLALCYLVVVLFVGLVMCVAALGWQGYGPVRLPGIGTKSLDDRGRLDLLPIFAGAALLALVTGLVALAAWRAYHGRAAVSRRVERALYTKYGAV